MKKDHHGEVQSFYDNGLHVEIDILKLDEPSTSKPEQDLNASTTTARSEEGGELSKVLDISKVIA